MIYSCTRTCITTPGGVFSTDDGLFRLLQLLQALAVDSSSAEWPGQQDKCSVPPLPHPQAEGHHQFR